MKNTITYSPSIFEAGAYEVLNVGVMVGFIRPDGDGWTACPHRNPPCSFNALEGALNYFRACFKDVQPAADGGILTNQQSLF